MIIAKDIANPDQAARYLNHGWAINSQGVKLLWLPILRLVEQAQTIRSIHGITNHLSSEQLLEIRAFNATMHHLALTLRELHKCIRIGTAHVGLDDPDNEGKIESYEASSLAPLFIDLSFIYLRRIADQFAMATRYVLFKKAGSAPTKYKKLRSLIASDESLARLDPICNADLLQKAFASYSGWLDKLRDSNDDRGKVQKGIRDIMEHFGTSVSISHQKAGNDPWRIVASLGHPEIAPTIYRPDLIQTLKEIVKEIATLWMSVCDAVGLEKAKEPWVAPYGDVLILTGNDDDIVGFWPEK